MRKAAAITGRGFWGERHCVQGRTRGLVSEGEEEVGGEMEAVMVLSSLLLLETTG